MRREIGTIHQTHSDAALTNPIPGQQDVQAIDPAACSCQSCHKPGIVRATEAVNAVLQEQPVRDVLLYREHGIPGKRQDSLQSLLPERDPVPAAVRYEVLTVGGSSK